MAAERDQTDWYTILLMALGFGLVGIDRFMISTLYPVIARDLKLGYADIGLITGALAFAWGLAALVMGNRADRIGRRFVLAGSLLAFALLIGASGLATGLATLIAVRIVMGFADGAYTPASIAATIEAAAPRHHGLAIGFQQMLLPVFGLGLAPLAISALLHVIDWRWTFLCFAAPGFVLAWAVWRNRSARIEERPIRPDSLADWRLVLSFRNIRLGMALMLCWLTCLITTSAFMPSYLLEHAHLSFDAMGRVMSAIGLGSATGTLTLAWASDRFGRKPMVVVAGAGACLSLLVLRLVNADAVALFVALFAVHFFNNPGITLTIGPLCTETVPPALMATASGVVIAVGEVLGGGLAPVVAGQVATRFGLDHLLWLPIAALAVAFVLSFFLIETRPRRGRPG